MKKGSWIYHKDGTKIAQGHYKTMLFLKDNPEFATDLENQVLEGYGITTESLPDK